jgi:hypothetical protein
MNLMAILLAWFDLGLGFLDVHLSRAETHFQNNDDRQQAPEEKDFVSHNTQVMQTEYLSVGVFFDVEKKLHGKLEAPPHKRPEKGNAYRGASVFSQKIKKNVRSEAGEKHNRTSNGVGHSEHPQDDEGHNPHGHREQQRVREMAVKAVGQFDVSEQGREEVNVSESGNHHAR